MPRNVKLYLEDIRDSADKVLRFTAGLSFEQFLADEKAFDAVVRNLFTGGESQS